MRMSLTFKYEDISDHFGRSSEILRPRSITSAINPIAHRLSLSRLPPYRPVAYRPISIRTLLSLIHLSLNLKCNFAFTFSTIRCTLKGTSREDPCAAAICSGVFA